MTSIVEHHASFKGVVRHRETEKYYLGEGQWTPDIERAKEFDSLLDLAEEARKYNIKDCCEFIIKIAGESDFSIFLPL